MRERIKQKIHNSKAFTLAETLLAVLILLMVSAIVAGGIPVAKNAYEKVVLVSNAETLISTTITALRNELGTAKDVKVEGDTITYYNSTRESYSSITLKVDSITICLYASVDGMGKRSDPEQLVSNAVSTGLFKGDLHVTCGSVAQPVGGVIKFSNLHVDDSTSGKSNLATRETVSIRLLDS